jgi:hypothetical protein
MAYEDLRRVPPWLMGALPVLLMIIAFRPRWFLYILPVLIMLAALRPRKRRS